MFDNRQFNVNGKGRDTLLMTLQLICIQADSERFPARIQGWEINPDFGMLLYQDPGHGNPLPGRGLTAEDFTPFLWSWLQEPGEPKIKLTQWDLKGDHDGENEAGWRVYCEDWGHVGGYSAFCAVKPVYLWLGK